MRDTINCDNRKQSPACFSCADTTCPLNYYYTQKIYRKRKTVRNIHDKGYSK